MRRLMVFSIPTNRIYTLTFCLLLAVLFCAPTRSNAAEEGVQPKKQGKELRVHGEGSTQAIKVGLVDVLKSQKLGNYPSLSIGEAFDNYRYFGKKDWKETHVKGKSYVDFFGWFNGSQFSYKAIKEGISSEGLGFKFVIDPDGNFGVVMVYRVVAKTDGNLYTYSLTDIASYLNKIYGNTEIRF